MKRTLYIVIVMFMSVWEISYGQDYEQDKSSRNWSLNGYLTEMPSVTFLKWEGSWAFDNLIHNRLNFEWHNQSNNSLSMKIELRNRLIIGKSVNKIPGYSKMIDMDNGLVKLSTNISQGKYYVFNSKIDRAYIDYTKGRFTVRAGRQRINWGQCLTWNPNDLFNASSFLDFDYVEKPGSDGIRLQYYTGNTSTLEFAVKADRNHKFTSALLYRFNKWKYDIQFLGGILNQEDYVLGAGWSGNIEGASFRGEASYFHPKRNFADTTGSLSVSLGGEYSFRNSLLLQFEMLYMSNKTVDLFSFAEYYNMDISAKRLSFTDFSILLQGSYPVSPLFNLSLSVMYMPKIDGYYISPSLSWSLADNLDLTLIAQSFTGKFQKVHTDHFNMGFLRIKWNF